MASSKPLLTTLELVIPLLNRPRFTGHASRIEDIHEICANRRDITQGAKKDLRIRTGGTGRETSGMQISLLRVSLQQGPLRDGVVRAQ